MNEEERTEWTDIRDRITAMLDNPEPVKDLLGHPVETQEKLQKQKHEKPAPEGLKRIKRIFGHRDTTMPNKAEIKAYNGLAKRLGKDALYSQIETITRFYTFRKIEMERGNTNQWSTSVQVLLNKWDEMHDRAVSFLETKPRSSSDQSDRPAIPEPNHWREWASHNWENGNIDWQTITWEELTKYDNSNNLGICLEIHRNCK